MADEKVTELDLAVPIATDVVYFVSDPGGTPVSKKSTIPNIVPDDSITLAKMAGGTDGNLITYDTDGNPVHVATGDATQVLTSNGVDTVPTFQDAGGAGKDMIEIQVFL